MEELLKIIETISDAKKNNLEGYYSIDTFLDPEYETIEAFKNSTLEKSVDFGLFYINHSKSKNADKLFLNIYDLIKNQDWR